MYYIYRITNLINSKTYIGQHIYRDINDSYMGSGTALRYAMKKYGKENFKKEILYSRIRDVETANAMECYAIEKEKSIGKAEYNLIKGGRCHRNHRHQVTTETRKKLSDAHKGKTPWNKGKKGQYHLGECSDETKKKISDAKKGKTLSEEHKAKISASRKGKLTGNTNVRGKHWFNNGVTSTMAFECPEGYKPGRIYR